MINPRMITLAREAAGLTQSALAHAVGISQGLLSRVEHGLDDPTEHVLELIARQCGVPRSLFDESGTVLGEGLVDVFHRKRLTLPAKPLRMATAIMNLVRLELERLFRSVEFTDVAPFPSFADAEPAEAANLARALWRVPEGPIPDLIALIEAAGAPIVRLDLGHEKLSAMCMPGVAGRHVIALNSRKPASHERFALAHELGHLVMHNGTASDDLERDANEFASELLMPASDIRRQLHGLKFRDLGMLKAIWRVSLAALIRRAHDLGEITDRQYRTFNMELNKLPDGRKREPGEFAREEPHLVRHVINHYLNELQYSLDDIARIMTTDVETLRRRYLGAEHRTLRAVHGDAENLVRLPLRRE